MLLAVVSLVSAVVLGVAALVLVVSGGPWVWALFALLTWRAGRRLWRWVT